MLNKEEQKSYKPEQMDLLKNCGFKKLDEGKNKTTLIAEGLLADYHFEEDSKLSLDDDDMLSDYKPKLQTEEIAEPEIFADYHSEKDFNDDILSDYKPESEIRKEIEPLEDYPIKEMVKEKKISNSKTIREKNSAEISVPKEKYFNRNIKIKKENTTMRSLAYELIELLCFKVIHKELYGYENGIYNQIKKEEDLGKFLMKFLPEFCQKRISRYADFREIFRWLRVIPELQVKNFEEEMEKSATCIPFQNGLYNIATREFLEYSEDWLVFYKLKTNYLGTGCDLPPVWNNFLFRMSPEDREVSVIICQMILNCLLIGNKSKTFALMLPASNSGKSVLGNLFIEIIGREHITTRSFSELSKRFGRANLEGMALNVCMEADTSLNKAVIRCIKGLTGESYINSEAKGANHEVIYNNIKLVFGVNDIPVLEEMDEAFFNRLQCIPTMYSVPVEQQDKFLLQKLVEEADQFLSWLVINETTEQFVNNNFSYSYCKQAEELKQAIRERCETCHGFLNAGDDMVQEFMEFCIEQTGNKGDFISGQILYMEYEAFCKEKNAVALSLKAFTRRVSQSGIGNKSKAYDPRIKSKSPLNGFRGIRLTEEMITLEKR